MFQSQPFAGNAIVMPAPLIPTCLQGPCEWVDNDLQVLWEQGRIGANIAVEKCLFKFISTLFKICPFRVNGLI